MAKKKSMKIPKRIGGVKVPKILRKQSGSTLVAEIMAAGLLAAATAMKSETGRTNARNAARKFREASAKGAGQATDLAEAVGHAVNMALERWFGGSFHWQQSEARKAPDVAPSH